MSQPRLLHRLQSVTSIIELEFKVPFTERGPPASLEAIFTRCLKQLEQEEKPEWIMWGDETTDPDKVCIMLVRKHQSLQRDEISQAAMAALKAKGMPRSIEHLSPFLTSEPRIYHIQSPDRNEPILCDPYPWQERHCDVFMVEVPSGGSLYDLASTDMMTLRDDCRRLLPDVLCRVDRPFGDIKRVVLGTHESDEASNPILGSCVCTFVFLIYWANPQAMARFKHPDRDSMKCYGRKVESNWWDKQVLEHCARLRDAGAYVKQGTFKLRDFEAASPLIWPDAEIMAHNMAQRIEERQRQRHKGCCIM